MNRKARRADIKRRTATGAAPVSGGDIRLPIADLMEQASAYHRRGQLARAQQLCEEILARESAHVNALNLSGLILQVSGRHRSAVKMLQKAVAGDPLNAACHYNLASSFEALKKPDDAALHFRKAIELGTRLRPPEQLILQNPAITSCVDHIEQNWPIPIKADELFARHSLESIAQDIFFRTALQTVPLHHAPLEKFLTALRSTLLRLAANTDDRLDPAVVNLFCALAQQCFFNEYVYAEADEETRRAHQFKELLMEKVSAGDAIPVVLLAAVAAYFPLHALPVAQKLLQLDWPEPAANLLRQQVREPLEELQDRERIPVLTRIDDDVSRRVMDQYQENPYPRWTVNPIAAEVDEWKAQIDAAGNRPAEDILIAGCGSGQHAVEIAQLYPRSRVLAVDLSLPSLAYARRKTRELGLQNVEYAQADILKLPDIGRSFDRIEAVGVLHHLAEPEAGWRLLLSILRPGATMRIGLYSEFGRRDVAAIRSFIAERGYVPTPADIRTLRQEILRLHEERGWRMTAQTPDFFSVSGCRDFLFNAVEHTFTVPRIKQFLSDNGLTFLHFDLDPATIESFRGRFAGEAALGDLDKWHSFETDHPQAFRFMYQFIVRSS
jgi:SAM-dependent methyltransferase